MIVSLSVKILVVSCTLCSPEATPSILPPVLHMLLSTLGYVSTLPDTALSVAPNLPSLALESLGQLCGALPMSHDGVGPRLGEILQSALTSVLGRHLSVRTGSGEGEEDLVMSDEVRLVVVAILLHASSPRNICPSPSELFEGCVGLFKHCLHSSETKVCHCTVDSLYLAH